MIDPTWGDRKVFRHYRASLTAFRTNGSAKPPEVARFRAANSATETRLRGKLPQLMREIDALYDGGPEWAPRLPDMQSETENVRGRDGDRP